MTTTPGNHEPLGQPNPRQAVIHSIEFQGEEILLPPYPSPKGQETSGTAAPKDFRFDAIMDVPEAIEPSMEPRLRNAFPELKWEEQSENWDKIRLWGTRRETPERVAIAVVRRESPGPFKLVITIRAQEQPEAVNSLREILESLQRALSGWSILNLPKFKTRPPSGIDIDQEEIVDLVMPVERPHVTLAGPNAHIILSRNLLEALSTHGEMLDSRAKEPKKYPGSNDEESRAASMRGARARDILRQAVPTGAPGQDLQVELGRVRQGQYLAGELLENGLAKVVLSQAPSIPVRRIHVHYFGSRMAPTVGFGFISYLAGQGGIAPMGEFLHLDWWTS